MTGLVFMERMIEQPIGRSVTRGNVYEGRAGQVEIGRVSGRAEAGPAVRGKFNGGQGFDQLARGLMAAANAREAEVLDRQKIEAIGEITAIQNEERAMFEKMNQLTSALGDQAPALAESFYEKAKARLDRRAQGDYQRNYYISALSSMRDQGLNRASAHRGRQREAYKEETYQGMQAQVDNQIAADPANYQKYTGQKIGNLNLMYSNAAPEWLAAKAEAIAGEDYSLAFESALGAGDLDQARQIMGEAYFDGDQPPAPRRLPAMRASYNQAVNARAKAEAVELKRRGDEIQKNMTVKWHSPEGLSREDVAAARDHLSPSDFDKYMARARDGVPPPSHSNRDFLIQARALAAGRAPDFQAVLDEGFKAGLLTGPDYNSLSGYDRKARAPIYRQSEEAIRLKTGRSGLPPDPGADLSYLRAMEDFDDWLDSDSGRRASDRDKLEMANRIGDSHRLTSLENNLRSLPAPLFLVGDRTGPDIGATARAARAAYEGGRMSEEQYNEECIRIKRMADILGQRRAGAEAGRADRGDR